MQHHSLLSGHFLSAPFDRADCCKPRCGYILEEICDHQQECCCFNGMLEICGLPCDLGLPLTLCGIDVIGISPHASQGGRAFCLRLCCHVTNCMGRAACGEACFTVMLRMPLHCCGATLRLGAKVNLKEACFCAPSAFQIRADVRIIALTTGNGRIIRQPPCEAGCMFPPLYPAPRDGCGEKTRNIPRFGL